MARLLVAGLAVEYFLLITPDMEREQELVIDLFCSCWMSAVHMADMSSALKWRHATLQQSVVLLSAMEK